MPKSNASLDGRDESPPRIFAQDSANDENDGQSHVQSILTPFPSLTGSKQSSGRGSSINARIILNTSHSSLQAIAKQLDVFESIVLQAAWASLLSCYTGLNHVSFGSCYPVDIPRHKHDQRLEICTFSFNDNDFDALQNIIIKGERSFKEIEVFDSKAFRSSALASDSTLLDLQCLEPHGEKFDFVCNHRAGPADFTGALSLKVASDGEGQLSAEIISNDGILGYTAATELLEHYSRSLVLEKDWNNAGDSKRSIVKLLNATSGSLHGMFERNAQLFPKRKALEFILDMNNHDSNDNVMWTYEELNSRADSLALALSKHGIQSNTIVPICMSRCPELYVAVLGILKAGAAWCPIDPEFPARRRHNLIQRTKAQVMLVNEDTPEDGCPHDIVQLSVMDRTCHTGTIERIEVKPDDIAYLIWTSGTTGEPKGVPIHHGAAVTSMTALKKAIPSTTKGGSLRCIQFSQYTFDVFIQDLFYTWGSGGTLVSSDRATMLASFSELATSTSVTHAHLTPAFAASIPRAHCPTLEVVTMIGEKLTQDVADDWSRDTRLFNTYGPAETTVVSTLREVRHNTTMNSANVGYPLPSVACFVMRNGRPVSRNSVGELALAGPQLSKGYWYDSQKSTSQFAWNSYLNHSLYLTGDIVREIYDGSLDFIGRTDDLVKVQGIRVEMSEIAYALRDCHPLVEQVEIMFLGRRDRPAKIIVAFLSASRLSSRHTPSFLLYDSPAVEIVKKARQEAQFALPDYMIPKIFLIMNNIPRTSSAKIDKTAMANLYASMDVVSWERAISGEIHAQRTQEWEIILDSIHSLTGSEKASLGRGTTLSSVGVDSIISVRLVNLLQTRGINVSMSTLLQCQNLGELSTLCTETESTADAGPSIALRKLSDDLRRHVDPRIANRAQLICHCLPIQESTLAETFKEPSSYWSNHLFALDPMIDLKKLKGAWERIALTTESLRTAFLPTAELRENFPGAGAFVQFILRTHIIDFTFTTTNEADVQDLAKSRAQEIAKICRRRHFSTPPWAVTVFSLNSQRLMMLTIHHAICDEVSIHFLMEDLFSSYAGPQAGDDRYQLNDALGLSLYDYPGSEEDKNFWTESLSRYTNQEATCPDLKLETDMSHSGVVSHVWQLKATYSDIQLHISRLNAYSVSSLIRCVWGYLILDYFESDFIVLGETLSRRNDNVRLSNVIGPLITVLPFPFEASQSVRETLMATERFWIQARNHTNVSPRIFKKLLNRVDDSPLYQAIFNFMIDPEEQNATLWQRSKDLVSLTVEHPIALNVSVSTNNRLRLELSAEHRKFDKTHLEILGEQIEALLEVVLLSWDDSFQELIQRLPSHLQSVTTSNEECKNEVWEQSPVYWVDHFALLHPEWTAVEAVTHRVNDKFSVKRWSYGELQHAYESISALIKNSGIERRMIGVCLERGLDVHSVLLGIMASNNIYLPIAEDLPLERKKFLLTDSSAAILFTTRSLMNGLDDSIHSKIILVDEIDYSQISPPQPTSLPQPSDGSYLLYTSGSTGAPKGVSVSRGNLVSFIEAVSKFICQYVAMDELQGTGKWLGMASYAFDVHLLEMFFGWRHGMATVTAPRTLLLDDLGLALRKLKITHASFVPTLVDHTDLHPSNLPDLQYMSLGGEQISNQAIATWADSHVVLANAYGPTEMTIGCSFKRVEPTTNVRNIGTPLAFTTGHVMRSGTKQYVLRGAAGELCLTGDLVATGYLNRPDAKGFVDNFGGRKMYRTGDRVRLMADGSLEFLGRKDDQTKIRGQRVELGEVTEAMRAGAAPFLHAKDAGFATLVAQHLQIPRPQLVAFICLTEKPPCRADSKCIHISQPTLELDLIKSYCREHLPTFMVPDHIIPLSQLPLSHVSRKVDKRRLEKLFLDMSIDDLFALAAVEGNYNREPSDDEKAVIIVTKKVLELEHTFPLTPDSNLFDLGLDSLMVVDLIVEMRKLGLSCSISDVMKMSTVKGIAMSLRLQGPENDVPVADFDDFKSRLERSASRNIDMDKIENVMPCLPLQETLIASSISHLREEVLYVNHISLALSQHVDHDRLIEAWRLTASDHAILRTVFLEVDNRFVQATLVINSLQCEQDIVNSWISPGLWLQQKQDGIAKDIVINIAKIPPFRLNIARSHDRLLTILQVSIHHSLYDVESFHMILDEVHARYLGSAERVDRTPFKSLLLQAIPSDHSHSESFWRAYLRGYEAHPIIRQSTRCSHDMVTQVLSLSYSTLTHIALSMNITTPSLLQASFGIALAQKFRRSDVVFGSILSGRAVPVVHSRSILAPCITTIPQRLTIVRSSLRDTIQNAHVGFMATVDHQHTALRDIHRWTRADKPLFDTLFSFTKTKPKPSWSSLWEIKESLMSHEFPLAIEVEADVQNDRCSVHCNFASAFGIEKDASSFTNGINDLLNALLRDRKIDLPEASLNRSLRPSSYNLREPEHIEQKEMLRRIVSDLTGIASSQISQHGSFFSFGIDSILAIQFAKKLRKEGFECSSLDIMRHTCIRDLVLYLESKTSISDSTDTSDPWQPDQSIAESFNFDNSVVKTYPCTSLQSSMLTQTLGSDGSLYVHQHVVSLKLDVGVSQIQAAWKRVVNGTEILRTTFHFHEGSSCWVAAVHDTLEFSWNISKPATNQPDAISSIRQSFKFQDVSDFEKVPWRIDLSGSLVILCMHHSLYDGESLRLLFSKFANFYYGTPQPQEVPFSVSAICMYQNRSAAEDFWLKTVGDFKRPKRSFEKFDFREMRFDLDLDISWIVNQCQALDVTLHSVALLAYAKTLAHAFQSRDVVFGHILQLRGFSSTRFEDTIGPLFNVTPYRLGFHKHGEASRDALARIQRFTADSQTFQHASLSRIQKIWQERSNSPDAELIDSIFVFQRSVPHSVKADLLWTQVEVSNQAASTQYPTNFLFEQHQNTLSITVNSREIYDLHEFLRSYERLFRDLLENSSTAVNLFLSNVDIKHPPTLETSTISDAESEATHLADATYEVVRGIIAEVSKIPQSTISNQKNIFSSGLDSISCIKIASRCKNLGIDLSVADIFQGATIDGMVRRLRSKFASQKEADKGIDRGLPTPSALPETLSFSEKQKALSIAGIRGEAVENVMICSGGQLYHLGRWLRSGRAMGEATWILRGHQRLDEDRILAAWRSLRARHCILRTQFASLSPRNIVQIILKDEAVKSDAFSLLELAHCDDDRLRSIKQESARRFDLFAPPCALTLLRGENFDIVLLQLHHALYDAWTIDVLLRDLNSLYFGHRLPLPLSPPNFSPMITSKDQRDYWTKRLHRAQQTVLRSKSQDDGVFFEKEKISGLNAFESKCRQHLISLSTAMQISFARQLTKYASVTNPVFGLFQAGLLSSHSNLDSNTFPTLNVTPVLVRDAAERSISDLSGALMSEAKARENHENVCLEDIFQSIDCKDRPLFNVFLNIQPHGREDHTPASDCILSLWDLRGSEDIQSTTRAHGRTAIDGMSTESLSDANLFLDVQMSSALDSIDFIARCDRKAMVAEDCRNFIQGLISILFTILD